MTDNNTALKKAGLKVTLPRLKILEVLQEPACHHVSAEDLYKRLIDMGEEIGLATVYRVLNQFDDAGIVTRHNFEGGKSVFELTQQHHHDHLICLDCGKVIEFSDESIETRQRDIATRHGIKLTNHSLYLYGHCALAIATKTKHCTTSNVCQTVKKKPMPASAFLCLSVTPPAFPAGQRQRHRGVSSPESQRKCGFYFPHSSSALPDTEW